MRASVWRCGERVFDVTRPIVMGVLNVTPDSFSDGGRFLDPAAAVARADAIVSEGASIVDVGGESTRPGAVGVSASQEMSRVHPVVTALALSGMCVSIDTRHPEVADAAVEAGASVINDISGFRDPSMIALAVRCEAGLVVMHMQGTPESMQASPRYGDVVAEVGRDLARQARTLEEAGVARERIALDPGIGFGKTLEHNLELIRRLPDLVDLGYPVLVGLSRKRVIGELTGVEQPDRRVAGSLAAAVMSVERGAGIVRAHDVAATVEALAFVAAVMGADGADGAR